MAARSDLEIYSLIYNFFLSKDKHLAGAIKSKFNAVSLYIIIDSTFSQILQPNP